MNNDLISRSELKKAVDTWDKFGYTAKRELIRLTEENKDLYVPYVKFDDVCYCIDNTPTVECPFYQEVYQIGYEIGYEEGRQERLKGEWILVGEGYPEEETDVLICNIDGDIIVSRGSFSTEIKDKFIWYTSGCG